LHLKFKVLVTLLEVPTWIMIPDTDAYVCFSCRHHIIDGVFADTLKMVMWMPAVFKYTGS
jgi:hypothetical protein